MMIRWRQQEHILYFIDLHILIILYIQSHAKSTLPQYNNIDPLYDKKENKSHVYYIQFHRNLNIMID